MAVFTPVSVIEARTLLEQYSLGSLLSLKGIDAGIENTNYFLDTTKGRYVLTLFEVLTREQLPFYIELMQHLAEQGIPVPWPQPLNDGSLLTELHDKPTAIVTRLQGRSIKQPTPRHCALSAQVLAEIHLAGKSFERFQPNLRGLDWWQTTIPKITGFLTPQQQALISRALEEQMEISQQPAYQQLPMGPAHCDLFRDNVLFDGTYDEPVMGGVIDFYFAGCDHWIFDVAVTVNDWCIDHATGTFDEELLDAWLSAYHHIRPFTSAEIELWPAMLRAAALRFWVSRLYDFYMPRAAESLTPHDPTHFERILTARYTQETAALDSYLRHV